MYAPYPENMMESIKKVEATRAERMATEPRRLTADEKDALLKKFHPDYNPDAFAEIKVGANKGQKAPLQLAEMLHSTSRLIKDKVVRFLYIYLDAGMDCSCVLVHEFSADL